MKYLVLTILLTGCQTVQDPWIQELNNIDRWSEPKPVEYVLTQADEEKLGAVCEWSY